MSKTLVCPHCRSARTCGDGIISVICGSCGQYFHSDDSLPESEAVHSIALDRIQLDGGYVKMRDGIERQADDYAKKVKQDKKAGKVRTHEPGLRKRDW